MTTDLAVDDLLPAEMSQLPFLTYLDDVQLGDRLLSGDISAAVLFACSDMGLHLPYVCSSEMARLFVFQTFGHNYSAEAQTVICQGVSDVIFYGHSNCKFLKFLAKSEHTEEEEALISKYFQAEHMAQKKYLPKQFASEISEQQWLDICRRNVLNEIRSMLSSPDIEALANKGLLRFHAWFLRSDTNTLEIFDPALRAFVSACGDQSNRLEQHSGQIN
jgi:carbonic anhydrase